MKLKIIGSLLSVALIFASCAHKIINKSIAAHYPYHEESIQADSSDAITVKPIDKLVANTPIGYAIPVKRLLIPLVFFTHWNYLYKCNLDTKQELDKLCSDIKSDCYKVKLDRIFDHQKIELTIEAAPTNFVYQQKGFALIYLAGYLYNYNQIVYPIVKENLVVSYKLFSNKELVKSGKITIADKRIEAANPNASTAKMIDLYIDLCRENILMLRKEFITQLEKEIKQ
jgi:hypothetical protein